MIYNVSFLADITGAIDIFDSTSKVHKYDVTMDDVLSHKYAGVHA